MVHKRNGIYGASPSEGASAYAEGLLVVLALTLTTFARTQSHTKSKSDPVQEGSEFESHCNY